MTTGIELIYLSKLSLNFFIFGGESAYPTVPTVIDKTEETLELLELLTRSIGREEMKKYYLTHKNKIGEFLPHLN